VSDGYGPTISAMILDVLAHLDPTAPCGCAALRPGGWPRNYGQFVVSLPGHARPIAANYGLGPEPIGEERFAPMAPARSRMTTNSPWHRDGHITQSEAYG
jgi:hypothetical protein